MFQLTDDYEEIKNLIISDGEINEECKFECLNDGLITYSYIKSGVLYNISIVADDSFFDEETPKTLLDKKRITFFQYAWYLKEENKDWEREGSILYKENLQA